MSLIRLALMAGGALFLSACISHEYGPIDNTQNRPFGYSEKVSGPNQVTVRTVGPSISLAKSYWRQRVSELCPKGDAKENVYTANYAAAPNMFGPVELGAVMEGTVICEGIGAPVAEINLPDEGS